MLRPGELVIERVMKYIGIFIIMLVFGTSGLSQNNRLYDRNETRYHMNGTLEVGSGILTHWGDLGKYDEYSYPQLRRAGYHISFDKRITAPWSISFQGVYGKIAQNGTLWGDIHNFESTTFGGGIMAYYHLDNTPARMNKRRVAPYLGSGVQLRYFNIAADIYSSGGSKYYYWGDGEIRDLPEVYENYFTANEIERDYVYETSLKDSINSFSPLLLSIPIEVGVKIKISPELTADLSIQYHFGFNDNLDGHIGNAIGDQFTYTSVGIAYTFGTQRAVRQQFDEIYGNVDLDSLDDYDYDGDGVIYRLDKCLGTPKGDSVDQWGCSVYVPVVEIPDSVLIEDVVIEIISNQHLDSVRYIIIDILTGDTVLVGYTNSTGKIKYKFPEPELGDELNYEVVLNKDGYFTKKFQIEETHDGRDKYKFNWDGALELQKIEQGVDVGKVYDLNSIYFDRDSYEIRPSAKIELDKIAEALRTNPTIEIELGSHTSSRGSDSHNQTLSENRAKSSVEYIVSKGIDANRISYKGYGETEVLNKCKNGVPCTDKEHGINRRTEFKVVTH